MDGMVSKGKVLLMDDEQIILDVTHEVLNFLGYDVVSAKEGSDAIRLYKEAKFTSESFDLVILDLSIPEGMNGRQTIESLRGFDPDVKAIVSSGYSYDPVMQDFARYGFSGKLTKPYRITEIRKILEEMIQKEP